MPFPTFAVYFGSCQGSATALKISNITGKWRTQRWKSSIFSFFHRTLLQYSLFHACYTNHNWQVSIYLKLFLVGPFSFSVISNQILSAASFHHPSNLSLTIPASKQKELADLGTYQGNTDRSETNQGYYHAQNGNYSAPGPISELGQVHRTNLLHDTQV